MSEVASGDSRVVIMSYGTICMPRSSLLILRAVGVLHLYEALYPFLTKKTWILGILELDVVEARADPPTHPSQAQRSTKRWITSRLPPAGQGFQGSAALQTLSPDINARSVTYLPKQTAQLCHPLCCSFLLRSWTLLSLHGHVSELLLFVLQLQHLFLKAFLHNEALYDNFSVLTQAVNAIYCLGFGGRVELWFHHIHFIRCGEV